MNQFISCDWGTSSLRLRLIENETQNILAEFISQLGIAATYYLWQKSASDRILFYESVLSEGIKNLSSQNGYSLSKVPIIISGMASSAIGMKELEYAAIPLTTNGDAFLIDIVESSTRFKHKMIIISGVKSDRDVMRGEETIIAGCDIKNTDEEQIFILPGTHSKHIVTENGMIKDFKTFMTGELFDLLSTKSILSISVEKENLFSEIVNPWFEKGVKEGANNNLLSSIFHVRTNRLFNKLGTKENYHYLSGLLIGAELKDLLESNYSNITVVSDDKFRPLYSQALNLLNANENIHHLDSAKALIKGQSIIYKLKLG